MTALDYSAGVGPNIRKQLETEQVIWLTTVSADGSPQPNPVWFVPAGEDVITYSMNGAARNANIRRHPQVSLNFNATPEGGSVGVLVGTAVIDDSLPPPNENAAYMEKYAAALPQVGLTPEEFARTYSVPIRITPRKLRGL